ncbi:hypothetical protein SAMN05216191_102216 [Paenibacillus jilunlii]|uniref:Uncharacterized protein n=1 Tax=Paenibacillus jilunlii TaxID=682956 RepID=A0A1G9IVF4_9BACL|nr:hypothetical protein SAMN05216191_102216 [Paenibacillus jilunlii]
MEPAPTILAEMEEATNAPAYLLHSICFFIEVISL